MRARHTWRCWQSGRAREGGGTIRPQEAFLCLALAREVAPEERPEQSISLNAVVEPIEPFDSCRADCTYRRKERARTNLFAAKLRGMAWPERQGDRLPR